MTIWGRKVYFIFYFQVIVPSLRAARAGRKAGPWRQIEAEVPHTDTYWLASHVFFSLLLYTTYNHLHRAALPSGLGHSTSIINQENIWQT